MLRGDVRGAFRYLTERGKGGILLPDNINKKTGDTIAEVLEFKDPNAGILDAKFPAVEQLWYADDARGAGRNFAEIHRLFHKRDEIGPSF
jgi:hypothetical protein